MVYRDAPSILFFPLYTPPNIPNNANNANIPNNTNSTRLKVVDIVSDPVLSPNNVSLESSSENKPLLAMLGMLGGARTCDP